MMRTPTGPPVVVPGRPYRSVVIHGAPENCVRSETVSPAPGRFGLATRARSCRGIRTSRRDEGYSAGYRRVVRSRSPGVLNGGRPSQHMETLNRMATELVDEAIDFAEELTIGVHGLTGDAAVLDFGVDRSGAVEAGLLLAEIQTAGLATVQASVETLEGAPLTHVELSTDHPALGLLCAGKASWELSVGDFEGLGSGPARALVAEEDIFRRVGYREDADFAVLAVETGRLPGEEVARAVAERAGVPESAVFLPAYATASVTGSVVAASRAAELATLRLAESGYDPTSVLSATGRAPVAPVTDGEEAAMARTTDALVYGGQVHLHLEEPVEGPETITSTAAAEHGHPCATVFEAVDWDLTDLPVDFFGPAQVTIDVLGGETHVVGETRPDVLAESFY